MCWLPSKLQSNKSGNTCVSYFQGCEATKAVTHDCDGCCKATKAVTHDSTLILVMTTLSYNPVFGAYEVAPSRTYRCLYRSGIQCYHLFNAIHYGDNVNLFIKSKYDLSVYCNH